MLKFLKLPVWATPKNPKHSKVRIKTETGGNDSRYCGHQFKKNAIGTIVSMFEGTRSYEIFCKKKDRILPNVKTWHLERDEFTILQEKKGDKDA